MSHETTEKTGSERGFNLHIHVSFLHLSLVSSALASFALLHFEPPPSSEKTQVVNKAQSDADGKSVAKPNVAKSPQADDANSDLIDFAIRHQRRFGGGWP
jgi:hypothetical protein